MPEYDINSNDPLEMVWAIREKIYEETKDMTAEERRAHMTRQANEFRQSLREINVEDYDLPFLHTKTEKQEAAHAESR
ncbi:MAG: hypothetical protein FWH27_16530 [Planctomycetaceae bacterium]|nr:hypothetical protein [Planctomycetaceae bacterium]